MINIEIEVTFGEVKDARIIEKLTNLIKRKIMQDPNCIFCKIASKESPAEIEYEDADVMAFWDIHPKAPTHILIIPKKHIASLNDVTPADLGIFAKMIAAAKMVAAKKNLEKDGYRLCINTGPGGGQIVDHLHMHLLGGKKFTEM